MSSRLRAPEDGLVASARAKGWAARRWMTTFDALSTSHHTQLARGRTLARSGRVRDLWFSPGLGSAEVVTNKESHRVSIRVRTFEDQEWDRVVKRLTGRLGDIASMLEGELPETLVEELDGKNLALLPTLDEIDGVCDCQDFHLPCAHMAAVHNVIAEALDGDPFLLLTLRGLNREQLLARLRMAWKDPNPLLLSRVEADEAPPETDDWEHAGSDVPRAAIKVSLDLDAAPGVRALGPPPGKAELAPALEPLYESGARAAAELAFEERPDLSGVAPHSKWEGFTPGLKAGVRAAPPPPPRQESKPRSLTEQLVDLLAELESAKSKTLAERLGVPVLQIRQELVDLESLGIVYRTGQTRGTRWWLG